MAYVQVAIRLWGKASLYAPAVLALSQVLFYQLLYEANAFFLFYYVLFFRCHDGTYLF